jgi:hypothetical protein
MPRESPASPTGWSGVEAKSAEHLSHCTQFAENNKEVGRNSIPPPARARPNFNLWWCQAFSVDTQSRPGDRLRVTRRLLSLPRGENFYLGHTTSSSVKWPPDLDTVLMHSPAAIWSISSGVSSRAPRRPMTRFDMNSLLERTNSLILTMGANQQDNVPGLR